VKDCLGDWAKRTFKALRRRGQLDCDELAATTGQAALGNDGKTLPKNRIVAEENSHRAAAFSA
jgi:hypothetical protein